MGLPIRYNIGDKVKTDVSGNLIGIVISEYIPNHYVVEFDQPLKQYGKDYKELIYKFCWTHLRLVEPIIQDQYEDWEDPS